MPHIQKVAIISRIENQNHIGLSQKIIDLLEEQYHLDVSLNDSFAKLMGFNKSIKIDEIKNFDLIVALGGDGTILWTARYSDEVPIFGINAGYLGFLTTATQSRCEHGFERIFTGDYILENCMRVKVVLDKKELPTALNEVYITNEFNAKTCNLNLIVDGFDLGCHKLDGFLISTPVGSTAYALSAGGAIIDSKIKAMQIVPVNSVMRRIRPFVVQGSSKVTISLPKNSRENVVVVNDGILEGKLQNNSLLEITKAEKETVFLRFPDYGFFNRLQDKLGF